QVFRVLQYLIESRARVVSKDEIIDVVWNGRAISDSALTYAIREARRLIGDDGKKQSVIRTMPRRGYRFVAEVTNGSIEIDALASQSSGVPPSDKPSPANRRWRISAVAAALVVIIAGAGLAWQQPWITKVEAADPEQLAFPLPDRPSIAVLPFENLSGDATQDYLSDGIAENIITVISRIPDIFVIPWTTTRTYKDNPVKVRQIAEDLGVRHVLAGSFRRSGDQVQVTAQLIDAFKGRHIWTESYDHEVKDTLALQEYITLSVLTELEVTLTKGKDARALLGGGTKNLEAFQLFRKALNIWWRVTKRNNPEIRRLLHEAVELDPNYAFAWTLLGWTHLVSANRGWSEDPAQDKARAVELANKALVLDPFAGGPYLVLANHALRAGLHDEAVDFAEKGVDRAPNNAIAVTVLANALIFSGRPEEALPPIQSVKRFSPVAPYTVLRQEGLAYHALGRYEEAAETFERVRAQRPKDVFTLASLAMIYADMGRMEEARAVALEVVKAGRFFSAKRFANAAMPHKDRAKTMRALATMLKAGLPE
ncbi:MAG: winged helix-turn-helix domain-containing protein, partial [Alphaproteobacteria bacterium]|nr:winged helix-turn-helix domain-containing protein [Alphaproteobacteria bacterium]